MKISIEKLKKIIRDQVERNLRWSAGFFVGGGIDKSRKGVIPPPSGLGSAETDNIETIDDYEKEQEKSQFAARVQKFRSKR